jgi:small-conductance mechanosensitive channel
VVLAQELLQQTFLSNTVEKYLISLAVFAATLLALRFFDGIVLSRLRTWAEKTETKFDDNILAALQHTIIPVLYFAAFYVATRSLVLNPLLSRGIDILGIVVLTISGIRFLVAIADVALKYGLHASGDPEKDRSLRAIAPILKVALWVVGLIFLLDNLGFEISAVVAGLGIGGIAVALAAQAVLKDLFSYVAIVFDRPFEIGDFIIIGEHMGTIEHIGIKTTRIRSLGGEQEIFANSDLTDSRVRNFKRMTTRRVLFKFGVVYSTTAAQLKEIPAIVRRIVEDIDGTTFDRAHFYSFGDFSLDFEVVYYIKGNDYNRYMDIQQTINLNLKEEFAQRNIEFAYPTQTLYLQR